MKSFQCNLFVLSLLFSSLSLSGQVIYPDNYFRLPLELPMALSGSFGEIRPNHLHSGIDLRTNQEEGYPVFAAASGYVSRVHVQAWGFGYSLYIDHPNGYTTVYGHLQRYNEKITAWLRQQQYSLQQFEVDLFPKPGELPVFKNDIVALTGSSGASGGPHLHYEIRNTITEYPINPLFFGYNLPDTIPPRFTSLRIIPLKGRGRINGKTTPVDVLISKTDNNHYRLSSSKPIEVSGEVVIGIEAQDFQNGNVIPTGVYAIGYYMDDICYTSLRLETFSFIQNRAANSILDYAECIKSSHRFIRSLVEPWNPLKIYDVVKDNGIFKFTDNARHIVRCVVKDFHGNTTELNFSVNSKVVNLKPVTHTGYQKIFYGNKNNIFETSEMKISIPKGDLYDTLYFTYHADDATDRRLISAVHNIQDKYTPVHDFYTLSIRTKPLKPELNEKTVMVGLDDDGSLIAQGGEWSKGFMTAKVKNFGRFGVAIDTIAPVIRPLTNFNKRTYLDSGLIQFRISDNLSGIKSYRGYLNGNWVLMSFDGKSSKLTLELNEFTPSGENTLRVELEDRVGNKTIFEKTFEN